MPGKALGRSLSRKEVFDRIAALSIVKRVCNSKGETNNDINRVFVFGGGEEDVISSIRDGLQRSLEEPPD